MKKIAVVTGGSRGIGRSIAITLAVEGYSVIINYNKSEFEAQNTLEIIKKYSDGDIFKADVSNLSEVKSMVNFIRRKYDFINVLVNNAGQIVRPAGWNDISEEDWDKTYSINAKGMYICTREMITLFKNEYVGHIVNIASTVGESGAAPVIAYSAAKAAVINMTKSFASVFAPNITVNAVAPGNIDTEMTHSAGQELVDWVIDMTPMRRLGHPQEVADLVAFLCSDKSNFITGQIIDIDGGYSWRK